MTSQQSIEAVAAAAAGAVLDAALALACLHFHLNWAAAFWLVLLLVSLVSLGDAARKRRTILRGGNVLLPPERKKDFNAALSFTFDIIVLGLAMRGVLFALHWMSHKSMYAILASLSRHVALVAFMAVFCSLSVAVLIYSYWLKTKRKDFLWSRPSDGNSSDAGHQDFDLPPLTIASLRQPAIGVFWIASLTLPFWDTWFSQSLVLHFSLHLLLADITICAATAAAIAMVYVSLVAFLTHLNNRRARLRARLVAFADETTWPPPPRTVEGEKAP